MFYLRTFHIYERILSRTSTCYQKYHKESNSKIMYNIHDDFKNSLSKISNLFLFARSSFHNDHFFILIWTSIICWFQHFINLSVEIKVISHKLFSGSHLKMCSTKMRDKEEDRGKRQPGQPIQQRSKQQLTFYHV